ncbi:unnamed protein product [Rotaria magnacalcarata]
MSIVRAVRVPILAFDANSVSLRSARKSIEQVISISDLSGSNGKAGANGKHGTPGRDGSFGDNGQDGHDGTDGSDGGPGEHGMDSKNALILLHGTLEDFNIQVKIVRTLNFPSTYGSHVDWDNIIYVRKVNYNFPLAKSQGIVLIEAIGGDGGNGGQGGDGGNGGAGGKGGIGHDGLSGFNAYSLGAPGRHGKNGGDKGNGGAGGSGSRRHDGSSGFNAYSFRAPGRDGGDEGNIENGDDGGDGGNGGNGGNGGDGGKGGNAGKGGHIQIISADPQLFTLIEIDCQAGRKGNGGAAGKGGCFGSGGSGGLGGCGGWGWNAEPIGLPGKDGKYGSCGVNGHPGSDGSDGCAASDGSVEYVVIDANNHILRIGPDKYHTSVVGYTITDDNEDGIYEPNSNFFVTNVKWINNGAMILPAGAILSFRSTEYISTDANHGILLQGASVGTILHSSNRFKCHMNSMRAISLNQPYIQHVQLTSQIHLLNRMFSGSEVSTNLICQYPIQIKEIKFPFVLCPNELAIATVTFTNLSTGVYGTCPSARSLGSVKCRFSAHSCIQVVPASRNEAYVYHNGIYEINQILPNSTKQIRFAIISSANTQNWYYDNLFWNMDLLLRDTVIEKHQNSIRIVPKFVPSEHTDILLITDSLFTRTEFLEYQDLFRLFNFSSRYWDMQKYGPLNNSEPIWLHTANIIIFIYSNPKSKFNMIPSHLLLKHMNSSDYAGFICIGNCEIDELDFAIFDYNNLSCGNTNDENKSEKINHRWSSIGFGQPDDDRLRKKANKKRVKIQEQYGHEFLYQVVYDNTIRTVSQCCWATAYEKTYVLQSKLNARFGNRLILVNSCMPFKMEAPFKAKTNSKSQSSKITQNVIDLNSNFGRLLCALLCCQGLERSFAMLSQNNDLTKFTFVKDSHQLNFSQILASLAMSTIEREYDRGVLEFPLSKQIVQQIFKVITRENITKNDSRKTTWDDILYLLIQSLSGYIKSKSSCSFPRHNWKNKRKQRHQLIEILNDLRSLSNYEIGSNKNVNEEVEVLQLQKLANLTFPITDKRDNCVRSVAEIQAWNEEQQMNKARSLIEEQLCVEIF